MFKSWGSNKIGIWTHVVRRICTKVVAGSVNSKVYPKKERDMFYPLTLVPIYQTAWHYNPRYCKLYTASCKINERQTTASSYSDKKDQTSEAWKCFPSATETNTRADIWLQNTSGWKYRAGDGMEDK